MLLTIDYIPQLASFLDEKQIKFRVIKPDTITFSVDDNEQVFKLGLEFGEWRKELEMML